MQETTLGDPEKVIWSSIRQLVSRGYCSDLAARVHGIRKKTARRYVAANVRLYVQQASEFYEMGSVAKPHTAPLTYYYAFLNLAKALCEFKAPNVHLRQESYRHGLSWTPKPHAVVYLPSERISIARRGVWHLLWEAIMGRRCDVTNPSQLRVSSLFSYCPEVSIEYQRTFGMPPRLLTLEQPTFRYAPAKEEIWTRFSVNKYALRDFLSGPRLITLIDNGRGGYLEVQSPDKNLRTFESTTGITDTGSGLYEAIYPDVLKLNLFTTMEDRAIHYAIPLQDRLPIPLPQVSVLYSILFWLGSLVRYDPHSVDFLMDSSAWILFDGFMSQSKLWLLELMEWAFFRTETRLALAR